MQDTSRFWSQEADNSQLLVLSQSQFTSNNLNSHNPTILTFHTLFLLLPLKGVCFSEMQTPSSNVLPAQSQQLSGDSLKTLRVKHLPPSLSEDAVRELFLHYGATTVQCLYGKAVCKRSNIVVVITKRGQAVVTFKDAEVASRVLAQFNKMAMHGKTIVAEYAREDKSLKNPVSHSTVLAATGLPSIPVNPICPQQGYFVSFYQVTYCQC